MPTLKHSVHHQYNTSKSYKREEKWKLARAERNGQWRKQCKLGIGELLRNPKNLRSRGDPTEAFSRQVFRTILSTHYHGASILLNSLGLLIFLLCSYLT